jgi:hypothetical protein
MTQRSRWMKHDDLQVLGRINLQNVVVSRDGSQPQER